MCEFGKKCEKEKPGKVHLVEVGSSMVEFARENSIEQVVKANGCLVVVADGNDYSEMFKRADKYVQKYNPEGLSFNDYREAHSKGQLYWQQE